MILHITCNMSLPLEAQIESILFWRGEPITKKRLAEYLNIKEGELEEALDNLKSSLSERGIQLSQFENKIVLTTHKDMGETIEKLKKEELTKDLSRAALQTLSIILYRSPIRRSEIDYIRGVNSQFILRALLIRGLIDKRRDPKDERSNVYVPSLDLLHFLGINDIKELPGYEEVDKEISEFEEQKEEAKTAEEDKE